MSFGRAPRLTIATATAAVTVAALLTGIGPPPAVAAPSPNLVNRAVAAGINIPSTPSWDLSAADYDGDGDIDISMSLHMKNAGQLVRNNGNGTFTRVAYSTNPATTIMPRPSPEGGLVDRHGCTWADFDRHALDPDYNERLDAYCSAGRYRSNRYKIEAINNELFLQSPTGSFTDAATASGVGEPCTRGRHVAALDVNNDGWQDLFLGAQKERADSADQCNREAGYPYNEQSKVFVNRGRNAAGTWLGFRFGTEWNVSQDNTGNRLALPWDYNRDGNIDLLTGTFPNKPGFLHRNTGTGFQEVARAGTVRLPLLNGATLADITGDGILDLVYADNAGFAYRAGTGTAAGLSTTSVRIGTIPSGGVGWTVAVGDVNGDGRPDVYGQVASSGSTGNPDDYIYVNLAPNTWQRHTVPSAGGDANDVVAVTVDGRAQFAVANGGNDEAEEPGPIQLIAWVGP